MEVFETEEVGSDVGSDDDGVIKEVEAVASTTPRDIRKEEMVNTNAA